MNYKISSRKGLGYVYFDTSNKSVSQQESIKNFTQKMSNTGQQYIDGLGNLTDLENIQKRDGFVIQILDIYKIPYTRDNLYGSKETGLPVDGFSAQNIENPVVDIPVSDAIVLDENNNEVPLEQVLNDPTATVTISDNVPVETDSGFTKGLPSNKKIIYIGLGVLVLAGYLLTKK